MTLDQQIRDLARAMAAQLSGQIEERLGSLATEVSQAAASDRVSVVRELRLAAEAEVAKRSQEAVAAVQSEQARRIDDAVAAARAEGARRLDETVTAVRAEQAQRSTEAIAAAVAAARVDFQRDRDASLGRLRADLSREHEAAMNLLRNGLAPQIEAALSSARAEHAHTLAETLARSRADAEQRVAQARDEERREAAADVDAVRREMARELDALRADHAGGARALTEARAAERQHELAQMERLTDAVRRIDAGRSLTDVLDALAEAAGREAPRVALFVLRGTRFTGWRHSGFAPGIDPTKVEVPVDQPGLLSRALRSGRTVSTTDVPAVDGAASTPFGVLPADNAALAVPIRIGGETVAVVYADDAAAERSVPNAFPEVIDVLACHAGRCLEVLTFARAAQPAQPRPVRPAAPSAIAPTAPAPAALGMPSSTSAAPLQANAPAAPPTPRFAPQTRAFQATGDEDEDAARRYARLLVSEIKLYHEAAVAEGRRNRNLLERLRPEIERAQQLYEERVPVQVRLKSDFFGLELVRTLAGGDPTLLGAR